MARSFSFLKLPEGAARDPRVIMRVVIGILLAANLAAGIAVYHPIGGSAEQLEQELAQVRSQIQQKTNNNKRLAFLKQKIDLAKTGGDTFMNSYFMPRRTTSSTILEELQRAAKDSGITPKGDNFSLEPIEGSDTLSMMSIVSHYEGSYEHLLQFVNKLDKSQRFLILENMAAQPLQSRAEANGRPGVGTVADNLDVTLKFDTFVREDASAQ